MISFNDRSNLISETTYGSHMPLETAFGWDWRNPLNILPLLVLFAFAIALLGCLMQLM